MTDESQIRQTIGRRLRAARRCRGLRLIDVAEKCGVRMQQVAKYETGANTITVPRLLMLSKALGVQASEIVGGL